ncbi:hypothetical protein BD770DRAFT_407818 [Pilaira anomala]|nr:hypothetical protein BD770DRAFT_407818 [Pilaira anomala]
MNANKMTSYITLVLCAIFEYIRKKKVQGEMRRSRAKYYVGNNVTCVLVFEALNFRVIWIDEEFDSLRTDSYSGPSIIQRAASEGSMLRRSIQKSKRYKFWGHIDIVSVKQALYLPLKLTTITYVINIGCISISGCRGIFLSVATSLL